MISVHFSIGYLLKSCDLHSVSEHLLDGDLIFTGVLHEEDVHDVHDEEDTGFPEFNLVSVKSKGHQRKIKQDEDSLSGNNPPVDQITFVNVEVECTYEESCNWE